MKYMCQYMEARHFVASERALNENCIRTPTEEKQKSLKFQVLYSLATGYQEACLSVCMCVFMFCCLCMCVWVLSVCFTVYMFVHVCVCTVSFSLLLKVLRSFFGTNILFCRDFNQPKNFFFFFSPVLGFDREILLTLKKLCMCAQLK